MPNFHVTFKGVQKLYCCFVDYKWLLTVFVETKYFINLLEVGSLENFSVIFNSTIMSNHVLCSNYISLSSILPLWDDRRNLLVYFTIILHHIHELEVLESYRLTIPTYTPDLAP